MFRRIFRMHASEHAAFAQKFEVVFLRLRGKAARMIGIPRREAWRGAQYHFVHAPHPPRPGQKGPRVVGVTPIPIAVAKAPAAAIFGRCESRIRRRAPPDSGRFEIRIGRHRLDFSASDIEVARQMPVSVILISCCEPPGFCVATWHSK